MKNLSDIAQGIAPSSTLAVDSLAKEMKIAILTTSYPLYIACGKLYSEGLCNN